MNHTQHSLLDRTEDEATVLAQDVVSSKMDHLEAIEQGLSKGMTIIGNRFENGEAYLPELVMAAGLSTRNGPTESEPMGTANRPWTQ